MAKSSSPDTKQVKYPIASVCYYGIIDTIATKVAVGIIRQPRGKAEVMRRWYGGEVDKDPNVQREIAAFVKEQGVRTMVIGEGVMGCPHEEGIDYPEGQDCPFCPFWKGKPRGPEKVITLALGEPGPVSRKSERKMRVTMATYAPEQWQRLREISSDKEDLEDTWEEWKGVKEEAVAWYHKNGHEVHEVLVDVDELREYCRQRGVPVNAKSRAEFAAHLASLGR